MPQKRMKITPAAWPRTRADEDPLSLACVPMPQLRPLPHRRGARFALVLLAAVTLAGAILSVTITIAIAIARACPALWGG